MSLAGLLSKTKGVVFIPIIVGAVDYVDYGAFIMIFMIAKIISALCTVELGLGFERFVASIDPDDKREIGRHYCTVMATVVACSVLGALLMLIFAPALSAAFLEGRHVEGLRIAASVVISNAVFAATRTFLWSRKRFAHQSAFGLGYELGPYVGFVVGVFLTGRLLPGVAAYALLDALAAGAMVLYAARGVELQRPSLALVKVYAPYTAPLALSNLEGGLLSKIDRFFIANLIGLEAVGVYNIAYRCTELVGFPSIPIRPQMMSYLSPAFDRGAVRESKDIIRTAVLAFLAVTLGLLACLALFSDQLFTRFLPPTESVTHLLPIVLLVGIGTLANASRRLLAVYVRLARTTGAEFRFQAVGLAVNVVGNLILIPVAGLVGAAVATLVSYAVILPLYARRRDFGFDAGFFWHLSSFGLIALSLWPLSRIWPSGNTPMLLIGAALCYLAYGLMVLAFKRRFIGDLRAQMKAWQGGGA